MRAGDANHGGAADGPQRKRALLTRSDGRAPPPRTRTSRTVPPLKCRSAKSRRKHEGGGSQLTLGVAADDVLLVSVLEPLRVRDSVSVVGRLLVVLDAHRRHKDTRDERKERRREKRDELTRSSADELSQRVRRKRRVEFPESLDWRTLSVTC